jgi:hypothetical protein
MDFRRRMILRDLSRMVEATKTILDELAVRSGAPVPPQMRSRVAEAVLAASRNGAYAKEDLIKGALKVLTPDR